MCKISIIIPVYNAEKYLKKCIDSVLAQTLKDIEIIAVDDGSVDKSGEILDNYANNYKNIKVIHQENAGASKARNTALEHVSGEYIGFVDSDDYIDPNMYNDLYNIAIKNDIDIVTSNFSYVNGDKITLGKVELPEDRIIFSEEIREIISTANKSHLFWFAVKSIYRTSMVKENNIFYNTTLKIGVEIPFVQECLLCANTMYYINKSHYFYVQSYNSITRVKFKENLLEKLQNQYFVKINLYKKYSINTYHQDLNDYTMQHTIPMLISNEKNHRLSFFDAIKIYKAIRNSEMVKNAYKNSSIKLIKSKLKYIAILLKLRLYVLVYLILKLF